MTGYALRVFKHLFMTSFRNSPVKILTIRRMMIYSLFNMNQIGPMMARPYELIDMTNVESQSEVKVDR